MKLTDEQIQLIQNALKNIDKKNRKLLFDFIVQYAEKNKWFANNLIAVLQRGVTFVIKSMETVANYNIPERKLAINSEYLQHISSKKLLFATLLITFRHEITHAADFFQRDENNDQLIKELLVSVDLAKLLYKKLNCIYQHHRVNTTVLNQLSLLAYQPDDMIGQIIWGPANATEVYTFNISLDNLGTFSDPGDFVTAYTTRLWHVDDGDYIHEITYDPVHALELFNKTMVVRQKNKTQYFEEVFHQFFYPKLFDLFKSLSKRQRQILSTLFVIQKRMDSNIAHDAICYPVLQNCMSIAGQDCFDAFLRCQSALSNKEYYLRTIMEIHACLQERADFHLLRKNVFENLCSTTVTVPPSKPVASLAASKDEPSLLQTVAYTGLTSAGYSLVDEIAQSYVQHHKLPHANRLVLAVNITYTSFVGLCSYLTSDAENASFALQVVTPVALTVLNKSLEHITNNGLVKYSLTALTFTTQTATSGLQKATACLAAGIAGSGVGKLVGRSLSSWLGWRKPNQITVTIAPTASLESALRPK